MQIPSSNIVAYLLFHFEQWMIEGGGFSNWTRMGNSVAMLWILLSSLFLHRLSCYCRSHKAWVLKLCLFKNLMFSVENTMSTVCFFLHEVSYTVVW